MVMSMPMVQTLIRSSIAVMVFAMLVAFPLFAPTPALADSDDQQRARQARLSGEVRPLSELLARVESLYTGDIIEVELEEDDDGTWPSARGAPLLLYEIKLLTPQGNLVKLEFDAKSLELLTVDGHDSDRARKDWGKTDD